LYVVGRDDLVLGDAGQASTRVDADDPVTEGVGIVCQLVQRVDRRILVHGDVQGRLVVPDAQILDLVAVLLVVVGVRGRQPAVEQQLVPAVTSQGGADDADVGVLGIACAA